MLRGVNEIHHTLANYLLRYAHNEEDWPPQVLSQQLLEIANQYRIGGFLTSAIEFARTRNWTRELRGPVARVPALTVETID